MSFTRRSSMSATQNAPRAIAAASRVAKATRPHARAVRGESANLLQILSGRRSRSEERAAFIYTRTPRHGIRFGGLGIAPTERRRKSAKKTLVAASPALVRAGLTIPDSPCSSIRSLDESCGKLALRERASLVRYRSFSRIRNLISF